MKRVSYMHKKFPKCIEVKTFLLECIAAIDEYKKYYN